MKYKRRPELVLITKLCTDPERDYVEDIFGNPVEMVRTRQNTPRMVTVGIKIPPDELKELQAIANLFGMSVSRYCRDAVRALVSYNERTCKYELLFEQNEQFNGTSHIVSCEIGWGHEQFLVVGKYIDDPFPLERDRQQR